MRALVRLAIVCCLSAAAVAALTAQSRRAMTIQDLLVAVRVADPQLAPDGRTVAFVRTTTEMPSGKRNADIWVTPTTGGDGMSLSKALITLERITSKSVGKSKSRIIDITVDFATLRTETSWIFVVKQVKYFENPFNAYNFSDAEELT